MNQLGFESALFRYGMMWRVVYGTLRIIIGITLYQFINLPFSGLLRTLMGYELSTDPSGFLLQVTDSFLRAHPFEVTKFIVFYFIFWGVLDIVLSICLLKHKLWAFPTSILLIALFVFYELFRYFHTHSFILLSVIVIDVFIARLIWQEYTRVKQSLDTINALPHGK